MNDDQFRDSRDQQLAEIYRLAQAKAMIRLGLVERGPNGEILPTDALAAFEGQIQPTFADIAAAGATLQAQRDQSRMH